MTSLLVYTPPPSRCGYLPDRNWQLTYEYVADLASDEYQERLRAGWRRFGFSLFRPTCPACTMCRSLRVPVATFRPDRSQRRAAAVNDDEITLVVGSPSVSRDKLDLYDRFHAFQHEHVGWPDHGRERAADYIESFVENPFPTEEWCYFLGDKLVGVGYVDALPEGLSGIYFYHDPEERRRSLGTYNVLRVLREAAARGVPYVYLGYYVDGCRSLEYKGRFRPNEVLTKAGWRPFLV
jgi:arginine-tRNA-protein transferase